jgi:hypothetical protein
MHARWKLIEAALAVTIITSLVLVNHLGAQKLSDNDCNAETHYMCSDGSACIVKNYLCNDVKDCNNNDDEEDCGKK